MLGRILLVLGLVLLVGCAPLTEQQRQDRLMTLILMSQLARMQQAHWRETYLGPYAPEPICMINYRQIVCF